MCVDALGRQKECVLEKERTLIEERVGVLKDGKESKRLHSLPITQCLNLNVCVI